MRTKKSKGGIAAAKTARDVWFPGLRAGNIKENKKKENKEKKKKREKKSKGGYIKNAMPKAKPC